MEKSHYTSFALPIITFTKCNKHIIFNNKKSVYAQKSNERKYADLIEEHSLIERRESEIKSL